MAIVCLIISIVSFFTVATKLGIAISILSLIIAIMTTINTNKFKVVAIIAIIVSVITIGYSIFIFSTENSSKSSVNKANDVVLKSDVSDVKSDIALIKSEYLYDNNIQKITKEDEIELITTGIKATIVSEELKNTGHEYYMIDESKLKSKNSNIKYMVYDIDDHSVYLNTK
ncbi:MAG: hypothetical protein RSE41_05710 [Clostridia bacterium]